MKTGYLKIHPQDNVLVALSDLKAGLQIHYDGSNFFLPADVAAKHKFLTRPVGKDEEIIMYGVVVGKAMESIPAGGTIHTGNVKHKAAEFTGKTESFTWTAPDVGRWKDKTFLGFHRADGQVGTANYWIIVPLVFCENRNVEVIAAALQDALGYGKKNPYREYVTKLAESYRKGSAIMPPLPAYSDALSPDQKLFPNIDGIRILTHEGGCGGTRLDSETLCALLAGYINNPNVAGATVLSLGCQNAQVSVLEEKLRRLSGYGTKPIIILEQQKEGTEQELLTRAVYETFTGIAAANETPRKPAPLSKLVIGLECGGSDGFSGISANPAIGHTSDLIAALGGSTILSEFPELCGVEQELINRCTTEENAQKFVHLMRSYSRAAVAAGSGFDMNPSPGNIKDGLITDAMKSAGAAKKGGTSPIMDVLDYAEYVTKPGLNLLCTPGNDVESTTAMAGSGANIILFTTGLGTPTGNPVVPVVKLASNTKLARKMPDIIDIDCGPVIDGTKTIEQMGEEILDFVIELASGRVTSKATTLDQHDFIPWKRGVSL